MVLLVVPYVWCRKRTRVMPEADEATGSARLRQMSADAKETQPNLEAAKRHLVRSSATVNERYLGPVSTSVQQISGSAAERH